MNHQEPIPLPSAAEKTAIDPAKIRAEFDLPYSGKHVVILRGTGKDKRLALLAAGKGADQFRILDAIAARLCLVDGKKMRLEDFDELDFDDSLKMSEEMARVMDPLAKATRTTAANLVETPEMPEVEEPQQF